MRLEKFFFKNGLCYIIKDDLNKVKELLKECYLYYDYRVTDENYKNEMNCILKRYTKFITDFEPILIEINENEYVNYDKVIKQSLELFDRGKKNNESIIKYFTINESLYNIFITNVLEKPDKILKSKIKIDFNTNEDKRVLNYCINTNIILEEVKYLYDDLCTGKLFEELKSINQKYDVVC